MPKKPKPPSHETILLILEILRRIPRNQKISPQELQKQISALGIERDDRTFQRQLKMLSQHFDIECDTVNKPYGYKWSRHAQGFSLPMMTEQESLLLALAQEHLRHLLPASLMKSMEGFFTQARYKLTPQGGKLQPEREWLSKVRVVSTTQPLLPPIIKPGVFEAITEGLYNNRWLRLEYQNASGNIKSSKVMPLGLAQQGFRLYLVCRFQKADGSIYENERSLALHRIISAKASSMQTFVRPVGFSLEKFDNDGQFGFGEGKRIRLTIHLDKEAGFHLTKDESPLSADQVEKLVNDQYEISATVVESAQLKWWLRGFGKQLRYCSIPFE
jgi:predicted DNA-binding transcriptional regulator YafY